MLPTGPRTPSLTQYAATSSGAVAPPASATQARTPPGGADPPAGLSASSAAGDSPCVVSPGVDSPASERNADGVVSRCSDQGNSTKNGVMTTMATFTGSTAMSHRLAASAPAANARPSTQVSGA